MRSILGRDLDRLVQRLGVNPFEVVAKEQNRDLKFAFRFRSLSKLIDEVIEHRRVDPGGEEDFLSMLMAARDRENDAAMTNKELIDEVMTLMFAGHDTTTSTIAFMFASAAVKFLVRCSRSLVFASSLVSGAWSQIRL